MAQILNKEREEREEKSLKKERIGRACRTDIHIQKQKTVKQTTHLLIIDRQTGRNRRSCRPSKCSKGNRK